MSPALAECDAWPLGEQTVVKVTRLDGSQFYINADLIELIETTPDTVLTLASHRKVVVCEPAETVVEQIIAYKRQIHAAPMVTEPFAQLPTAG